MREQRRLQWDREYSEMRMRQQRRLQWDREYSEMRMRQQRRLQEEMMRMRDHFNNGNIFDGSWDSAGVTSTGTTSISITDDYDDYCVVNTYGYSALSNNDVTTMEEQKEPTHNKVDCCPEHERERRESNIRKLFWHRFMKTGELPYSSSFLPIKS